jgi:hypothetical protein
MGMSLPAEQPGPAFGPLVAGLTVVAGALMAAAALLWFWYGTRVFFEMVAAGIAYCF